MERERTILVSCSTEEVVFFVSWIGFSFASSLNLHLSTSVGGRRLSGKDFAVPSRNREVRFFQGFSMGLRLVQWDALSSISRIAREGSIPRSAKGRSELFAELRLFPCDLPTRLSASTGIHTRHSNGEFCRHRFARSIILSARKRARKHLLRRQHDLARTRSCSGSAKVDSSRQDRSGDSRIRDERKTTISLALDGRVPFAFRVEVRPRHALESIIPSERIARGAAPLANVKLGSGREFPSLSFRSDAVLLHSFPCTTRIDRRKRKELKGTEKHFLNKDRPRRLNRESRCFRATCERTRRDGIPLVGRTRNLGGASERGGSRLVARFSFTRPQRQGGKIHHRNNLPGRAASTQPKGRWLTHRSYSASLVTLDSGHS